MYVLDNRYIPLYAVCCFPQASKEQVLELNAELDSLKMEMGNGRGSSGNSLFGEVREHPTHTPASDHWHITYLSESINCVYNER